MVGPAQACRRCPERSASSVRLGTNIAGQKSESMTWYAQADYDIKLEWGTDGLRALKSFSDVLVIVDVLSFTTCVTVAAERGGLVFPYPWKDERAAAFARENGAELAGRRGSGTRISLSPESLAQIAPGEKVVLPSPNGSQLSTETDGTPTVAACLRNARAAAAKAAQLGKHITVIAAGERWRGSDTLRPALEDLLGAGAVVAELQGTKSPEAMAAEILFLSNQHHLGAMLRDCSSGRELVAAGFSGDVAFASEANVSEAAPVLCKGKGCYERR